jgi:hypothetical protein
METRAAHLAWCKQRALAYVDAGDLENALASIGSDLRKHPETADHQGMVLGMMLMMAGHLDTDDKMRKFINGFN